MKRVFLLLFLSTFYFSCQKEYNPGTPQSSLPTLTTVSATNITSTSATSGGIISDGGTSAVTARGVCWSLAHDPDTSNSHTLDGTGTGSFVSQLAGLTDTTYYVRAYAINSSGVAYGNEISFLLPWPLLPPRLLLPLQMYQPAAGAPLQLMVALPLPAVVFAGAPLPHR
jgi:hypothetical protein